MVWADKSKSFKTCFGCVSWIFLVTGTSSYPCVSLPTTVVITPLQIWLFLRLYMEEVVDHTLDCLMPLRFIRENLKSSQCSQKDYTNKKARDVYFKKSDHKFLQISLIKGMTWLEKKGKIIPEHIVPFEDLEDVGPMVYRLDLAPILLRLYPLLYVWCLKSVIEMEIISSIAIQCCKIRTSIMKRNPLLFLIWMCESLEKRWFHLKSAMQPFSCWGGLMGE